MARSVPSKFSRAPDEGKEKSDSNPDEQKHSDRSTASPRPALPAENVIPKAGSPSPHHPGSGPPILLRKHSRNRNREHEGVEVKATRAPEPPTSERDGKQTTALLERELREIPVTGPYNLRKNAEPTPPSSFTRHNKRDPQTRPENPTEQTNSPSIRKSDSGYGSRGPTPDQGPVPLLSVTRSTATPPTSFTTQSQPKHVTRASSTNDPTISSADHRSRPLNAAGGTQIQTAPSMSTSISSRAPAPAASLVAHRDGGTPSGPIKPSNSTRPVWNPPAAVVAQNSQDVPPSTRTLRETDGDTSSRLPGSDGGDSGQTRIHSGPQLDPTPGTGENNPLTKPGYNQGLIPPSSM